ncbi:MAG: glycine cleavage system protein R [Anaerolineae bacterium]
MRENLVLTLTGRDRIGIVERITKLLLEYDGNVETSRMARLGGEFAMLMLVSVPAKKLEEMRQGVRRLRDEGYKVTTRQTERGYSARYAGWMPFQVKVSGADHEGIIHHIAHQLTEQGINIETMDTGMVRAPMSGTPLFMMTAIVVVPPDLPYHDWRDDLEEIGDKLNVDTEVSPYTG